jgi:drug/metabolite transporter (DMT)-like permease
VTSPSPGRPSVAAVATALTIVYVVWGSTYLAIAEMIETLPPLLSAGARFVVAGVLMLGVVTVVGRIRGTFERPTRAQWRTAGIVGTLLLLGGNGAVVLAELLIPSGIAAVLVATVPIWLALFDSILERHMPSRIVIAGLVAGIVGVGILLAPVEGIGRIQPLGVLLVVGGALSWALGSLYARRAPLPRSGLLATGMEMLAGGAVMFAVGLAAGELGRTDLATASTGSVLAFAYLVVFGSFIAFTAYTWLLANTSVTTVGTYAYVNPLVAVVLGAAIRDEPITIRTVLAAVLILGAVVAMLWGRARAADAPATEGTPSPGSSEPARPATPPAR